MGGSDNGVGGQLSPDVLDFLALILSRQSLSISDPEFEKVAALMLKAKRELLAAIESTQPMSNGSGEKPKKAARPNRSHTGTGKVVS